MQLIKIQHCIDDRERVARLCEHQEAGQFHFRKDFELAGFSICYFASHKAIIDFLDKHYPNETPFYIANDEVYYPLSEGDRELQYFASIGGKAEEYSKDLDENEYLWKENEDGICEGDILMTDGWDE
jgi:hypothetical protein